MTPAEVAATLRQFNGWRRDFEDKFEQPDAREISEAIDAAIEMIERLEAAESECLEQARLNGMGSEREAALMAKLEAAEKERDALRAKIEAMERQVPICLAEDLRYAENLLPALGLMPEDKLYALPGAHPAPSVPDAMLVAVADLVAQMEIVSRVGFVDTPNDKDSCAAFCVAEGTWLELMSAVESVASALAAAPETKP